MLCNREAKGAGRPPAPPEFAALARTTAGPSPMAVVVVVVRDVVVVVLPSASVRDVWTSWVVYSRHVSTTLVP